MAKFLVRSQKKQIDASVAVSIFTQYQHVTTQYHRRFACESNVITCVQINVAQYCLFDDANPDYVAYKQCNIQFLVSVDTLRSHIGLQTCVSKFPRVTNLKSEL